MASGSSLHAMNASIQYTKGPKREKKTGESESERERKKEREKERKIVVKVVDGAGVDLYQPLTYSYRCLAAA
jgi:hypothetical protein